MFYIRNEMKINTFSDIYFSQILTFDLKFDLDLYNLKLLNVVDFKDIGIQVKIKQIWL